jgi:protein-S-isoprenylcysteine O-methyltransferase Ste14
LETLFRVLVLALFTTLAGIRVFFRVWSGARAERPAVAVEGFWVVAFRVVLMIPLYALTFLYAFWPDRVAFLAVDLPPWSRLLGLPVGMAGLGLLAWAHGALDGYFSPTLRLREHHELIDHGPYAWIQHPMYTAFLAFFVGIFLLSAHPWIGGLGVAVIGSLMTLRLPKEEAMLATRFGERYRRYRARTGRFLPRLTRAPAGSGVPDATAD